MPDRVSHIHIRWPATQRIGTTLINRPEDDVRGRRPFEGLVSRLHTWFLTSDRQLPRQMRLAETRKPVLYNGALECRFFRFELVGGRYRPQGGSRLTTRARIPAQ